jgi:hypothetical protein
MPAPVKVSDKLLALAKAEARGAHRSATAQIEHWATLGRTVEVMAAYRDVLALKRVGAALPMPAFVPRAAVREVLEALVGDPDRAGVQARIRAAGGPVYASDPDRPGVVTEVGERGRRTPGRLVHRRFVPTRKRSARKRS